MSACFPISFFVVLSYAATCMFPGPPFDTLFCPRFCSEFVCARLRVYALSWRVYALVLRVALCSYAAVCARMRCYAPVCVLSTNLCIKGSSRFGGDHEARFRTPFRRHTATGELYLTSWKKGPLVTKAGTGVCFIGGGHAQRSESCDVRLA